jgi:hypothetical protein
LKKRKIGKMKRIKRKKKKKRRKKKLLQKRGIREVRESLLRSQSSKV